MVLDREQTNKYLGSVGVSSTVSTLALQLYENTYSYVLISQTFRVPSPDVEYNLDPSILYNIWITLAVCPLNDLSIFPLLSP